MQKLAATSLLLVLALVSISAYLRLEHSGIGCADWPGCYGKIGTINGPTAIISDTYERLLDDATKPASWATPAHRFIASVLGLMVVAMTLLAFFKRRDRLLSIALLSLTVFLAWLGIYSGGLHAPGVVMGNLGGGFLMLALLGWMVFRQYSSHTNTPVNVQRWAVAALAILGLQIFLGGLTSANFAASACQTVPDCHGSWLPGANLWKAFDLSREHTVSASGVAIGGQERMDIQILHRIVALITLTVALVAGVQALLAKLGRIGTLVIAAVVCEFGLGIAAILAQLPITVAVAHNFLAAILLLALLRLIALSSNRQANHSAAQYMPHPMER